VLNAHLILSIRLLGESARNALTLLIRLSIELSTILFSNPIYSCELYDVIISNRSLKFNPHLLQPFELCQLDQN